MGETPNESPEDTGGVEDDNEASVSEGDNPEAGGESECGTDNEVELPSSKDNEGDLHDGENSDNRGIIEVSEETNSIETFKELVRKKH